MQISIGNDHAGPEYKKAISDFLKKEAHDTVNHGTDSYSSVDYPDFIHPVAKDVSEGRAFFGIILLLLLYFLLLEYFFYLYKIQKT